MFEYNFSVTYRDVGHWDIYTREKGRLFCLRGEPGNWYVRDERKDTPNTSKSFDTQAEAMSWVCSQLMCEPELDLID